MSSFIAAMCTYNCILFSYFKFLPSLLILFYAVGHSLPLFRFEMQKLGLLNT